MNQTILIFLNSLTIGHPIFSDIIRFLSNQFSYLVIIFAIFLFFFYKSRGRDIFETINNEVKDIVVVMFSALGAWGISFVLKNIIDAPRPYQVLDSISPLYSHGFNDSFPSGHATLFFALATAVYFHHKKSGIFLYVCALVIVLCRIIAGIHYPFDILAGIILGVIFTILVNRISSKVF